MAKYVYVLSTGIIRAERGPIVLHDGDVWDADDPFVIERPDLFSEDPPVVHNTRDIPTPKRESYAVTATRKPNVIVR